MVIERVFAVSSTPSGNRPGGHRKSSKSRNNGKSTRHDRYPIQHRRKQFLSFQVLFHRIGKSTHVGVAVVMNHHGRRGTLSMAYHFRSVRFRPVNKGLKMRHQAFARFGERIFHSGRHLGIKLPANQVQLLQTLERLRQHLLRAVGHVAMEAVKPHRSVQVEVI